MADQRVLLRKEGSVAWLTLNRPTQGNAPDPALAGDLRDACTSVAQDDDVRVVLLTGAGKRFCDAPTSSPLATAGQKDGLAGPALEEWLEQIRVAAPVAALEKPVIAAINGNAIGQGLEMALACDLRIAARAARFALPNIASGLLPWDGGTQRLPRIVGRARALELLLTGREVDSQEALDIGLVHEVTEGENLLPRAKEVAERIASYAPIAARYAKEAVLKGLDLGLEAGLRLEADLNIILQSTADRTEGVRSFLERREPRFQGK